jgi:hypothetical protein
MRGVDVKEFEKGRPGVGNCAPQFSNFIKQIAEIFPQALNAFSGIFNAGLPLAPVD